MAARRAAAAAAALALLLSLAAGAAADAASAAGAASGAAGAAPPGIEAGEQPTLLALASQLLAGALPPGGGAWAPGSLQQGMDGGDKGDLVSWLWRGISYNALAWVPLAGASVFAVCIGVHAAASLLARRKFEALGLEQRLVTYTHLAFAVVFSLQLVPYTVLAIRFLFRRWTPEYFVGSPQHISQPGIAIGLIIFSHAFLYCYEGSLRVVIKPNAMLLVHHSLFFVLLAWVLWSLSPLLLKLTVVLDLFAVHEAPLYVALLTFRLSTNYVLRRATLIVGLGWYGITRLAQTAMIIWILAAADASLRPTAAFIVAVLLITALSCVQAFTFKIYAEMFRRARPRRASAAVLPVILTKARSGSSGGASLAGSPSCHSTIPAGSGVPVSSSSSDGEAPVAAIFVPGGGGAPAKDGGSARRHHWG